jgi:hypothetical protein
MGWPVRGPTNEAHSNSPIKASINSGKNERKIADPILLLYAHTISPRLRYITQWFEEHYLDTPLELTDSIERYKAHSGPCLNYSAQRLRAAECWIEPHDLLFEENIRSVDIAVSTNGTFPIFFCRKGDLGFDLWAASFYLISRYEEYLPHRLDAYGRYDFTQSLAATNDFLDRPLVDEWMATLVQCLRVYFPSLSIRTNRYQHLATYDIDESYAYRHKSFLRQVGGAFRELVHGRLESLATRMGTWCRLQQDPYDAYSFLQALHPSGADRPIVFFHVASQRGPYDKNISPDHPAQKKLIRSIAGLFDIGLHPSWYASDHPSSLVSEKNTLDKIVGWWITASRQHYIRFQLPDTYNLLLDAGISDEYSMGYGSVNGFRASTSRSFHWFNLTRNQSTSLRIHPFCYMEANSFFEAGHTIEQAEAEWRGLEQAVRQVQGRMITIWHNTFLGTQKRFAGWRDRYAKWLREQH